MRKAVAAAMTAFFILYGIPVPTSIAAENALILNEQQQLTPVKTLEQANAQSTLALQSVTGSVPSGVAIPNDNPLSLNSGSLQADGNPSPTGASPQEAAVPTAINFPPSQNAFASSSPNSGATASVSVNGLSINFSGPGVFASSGTGGISYDDPSTTGTVETVDLSGLGRLTMGLQGFVHVGTNASGNYRADSVWLTIVDRNGKYASVLVSGIVASQENLFSTNLGLFSGVDLKNVRAIRFSVDGYNVTGTWLKVHTMYQVPQGWTRAESNANFAFAIVDRNGANNNNYRVLKVQDLRTGAVQELYSLQSPPYYYTTMGVSPDGKMVYFGVKNGYSSAPEGWLRVQQMSDPSQKTDVGGIPSEVSFLPSGDVSVTLLTSFKNGTELGNVYTVDRTTMQSRLSKIKLVTRADAVLDGGYLVIPERSAYSNTFVVTVYDASKGIHNLVKVDYGIFYHASQAAGGSSGSGSYAKIDVTKTPEGRKLILIGISAVGNAGVDYSQTFILDPKTGQKLEMNGAMTSVMYSGHDAVCTVKAANGSMTKVKVDLQTLQIVQPLPVGWSYAKSNDYFAFRSVVYDQVNARVEMIDLRNPSKVMIVGEGSVTRHNPVMYDVSPDGGIVVVAHHDTGGVVGQLSDIVIYRTQDLVAGSQPPSIAKVRINTANVSTIRFVGSYVVITAWVRGPNYDRNGQKVMRSYKYLLADLLK